MNPLFRRLMGNAGPLGRPGDLRSATQAIQNALARLQPADHGVVIDLPAREAPRAAESPHFIRGQYADGFGTRDYKLFIPPNAAAAPLPLVVMLHGCTQDPDDFAAGTGMNEAAAAQGFYVLYPAQTQNANAQRCWNWFKHNHQQRGRGEPALLAGMTRSVMAEYPIDPKQVFVAGLSAGGAMAAILGDAYPELFAAVGVHSGLPTGSATDVSSAFAAMQGGTSGLPASTGLSGLPGMGGARVAGRARRARTADAPPVIVFHGDDDKTVHPVNGEHIMADCQGALSERKRSRSTNGREYTRHVQLADDGRILGEHWVVHGAGHAWSGGRPQGSYTDARGPDATQEMLRFFRASARV